MLNCHCYWFYDSGIKILESKIQNTSAKTGEVESISHGNRFQHSNRNKHTLNMLFFHDKSNKIFAFCNICAKQNKRSIFDFCFCFNSTISTVWFQNLDFCTRVSGPNVSIRFRKFKNRCLNFNLFSIPISTRQNTGYGSFLDALAQNTVLVPGDW